MTSDVDPGEHAGSGAGPGSFPGDLLDAYRRLLRSRLDSWSSSDWSEAYRGIADSSRTIRVHPFWRNLSGPSEVARAAADLTRLARLPLDGERAEVALFPPPEESPGESCSSSAHSRAAGADLAAALDRAGLWDVLSGAARAAERRYVEQTGLGMRHEFFLHRREFFADGEHLSEFGVLSLLDEMAPSLIELGLPLDVRTSGAPLLERTERTVNDPSVVGGTGVACPAEPAKAAG